MKKDKQEVNITGRGIGLLVEMDYARCEYCFESFKGEKYAHVYNLFVSPMYRKQGRAKKILKYIIDRIRANKFEG